MTERGKEGRREGTRAKPGNQLVYYICIHLLDPHWTMLRHALHNNTKSVSLSISKNSRTVKRHIIKCKQL